MLRLGWEEGTDTRDLSVMHDLGINPETAMRLEFLNLVNRKGKQTDT